MKHYYAALFVVALCCSFCVPGGRAAYVQFNARGIRGVIMFNPEGDNPEGGNVRITGNLEGLPGNHNWHVHSQPVDQTVGPDLQCLSNWAGPHYDPFNANTGAGYTAACASNPADCEAGDLSGKFGQLNSSTVINFLDDTTLAVSGRYSIIGRSVVIHEPLGANFICGTIREDNGATPVVLQATFISPVAGSVYMRQIAPGGEVQIWGKVYWTDDTESTLNHNWHIHENAPSETYRIGMEGCTPQIVGPHYDPTNNSANVNYSIDCNPSAPEQCEIGDLTGKHSQINIGAVPFPYRDGAFFFTDPVLNLTSTNPVVGRSIAIHAPDGGMPIIACAPLVASQELRLMQYPPSSSFLTVTQRSPYENTVFTTQDLPEPLRLGLLNAALNPNTNCRDPAVEEVPTYDALYTPFSDPEAVGTTTVDANPVGDLTARYGSDLTDDNTFSAFSVPVYGSNVSISSRSVRFFDGDYPTCAALIPMLSGSDIIFAKASFNGVISGAIYFVQQDFGNDILGNTYIIVDIYYSDADTSPTTGHNWHVHQNPSVEGQRCVDVIGPHFNPFEVSLGNTDNVPPQPVSANSNYRDDCSTLYSLRCESGDLSNKHGQLRIAPDTNNRPTFTYVDSNLQLSGSYSIVGRSIGLHDIIMNAPLFDCGEIGRSFISSTEVVIVHTAGSLRRTQMAQRLTEGTTYDPTDVLILRQEVAFCSDAFNCVTARARVLGATQSEANAAAVTLQDRADLLFECGGAVAAVAPLSLLLLAGCLLLALFN